MMLTDKDFIATWHRSNAQRVRITKEGTLAIAQDWRQGEELRSIYEWHRLSTWAHNMEHLIGTDYKRSADFIAGRNAGLQEAVNLLCLVGYIDDKARDALIANLQRRVFNNE